MLEKRYIRKSNPDKLRCWCRLKINNQLLNQNLKRSEDQVVTKPRETSSVTNIATNLPYLAAKRGTLVTGLGI